MTESLQQLGTILLTSVVHNEHFRYAGLVAEDPATLKQFIEGLLAVQDVVYVVITRLDGTILAQHTKGTHQSSAGLGGTRESFSIPGQSDCKTALPIDK